MINPVFTGKSLLDEIAKIADEVYKDLQKKYSSENNFGDRTDSEIRKMLSEIISDVNK